MDREGRRQANKVFDAQHRLLATERFHYDSQGRLSKREYIEDGGNLKWRWQRVEHNDAGEPIRNEIVNRKGKKIGTYVWHYDELGRLARRERLNADGTVRFYYADIEFDEHGDYSKWSKYNAQGRKVGSKQWKFAAP